MKPINISDDALMPLVEIILTKIPDAMLERVVADQGILSEQVRSSLFKASGLSRQQIAQGTVNAYGNQWRRLASGLYDQVLVSGDFATQQRLVDLVQGPNGAPYQNHQASLVARIPNLSFIKLLGFLEGVMGQVCLVVSRKGAENSICGTGFLVAPDLVLTCQHVLRRFSPPDDPLANGDRIEIYFDFTEGEPVDTVGMDIPGARKVGLRAGWHVVSSPATAPDGMDGELAAIDAERITRSLDFVLLQLDEPVGLQPVSESGGRRREWINLPAAEVPKKLLGDDWIIIPQHPNGAHLRIDFGRFKKADQTDTRIRYNTNTAPGTSGAPCFNQNFDLVGLHNATVEDAVPPQNQAIRFDYIAERIRTHLKTVSELGTHARRWSTSRTGEPAQVILGRDSLLEWLERSRPKEVAGLRDRVYVATASAPGAGCTFSSTVLHAELRDQKVRAPVRAVYGSIGQQLPGKAEDFLISLLREFDIDVKKLPPDQAMPARPGASSTAGSNSFEPGEIDKLERWLADELPKWLGEVITRHVERELDAREAARQTSLLFEQEGREITADIREKAEAPSPIMQPYDLWDCAYVVIDDLRQPDYNGQGLRTDFSREVLNLVAALIKGKPESAAYPGLRRLRWMFLGYLPDFIGVAQPNESIDGATVEKLEPTSFAKPEVLSLFNRIAEARTPGDTGYAEGVADTTLVLLGQMVTGPENRLARLQAALNQLVPLFLDRKKG